jgi:RNA polymerase sigma factor (sigma-70 family)
MARKRKRKRLTARRKALAARHLDLAARMAARTHAGRLDLGQRESAAAYGLCVAAIHWRPEKGPFRRFASHVIRNAVFRDLEDSQRRRTSPLAGLEPDDPHDDIEAVDLRDEARTVILDRVDVLSPRQREALTLFLGGLRWIEVAERMGVSKQAAENFRARIVAKLSAPARR